MRWLASLADAITYRICSEAAQFFSSGPDLSVDRLPINKDHAASHSWNWRAQDNILFLTVLTYLNYSPGLKVTIKDIAEIGIEYRGADIG